MKWIKLSFLRNKKDMEAIIDNNIILNTSSMSINEIYHRRSNIVTSKGKLQMNNIFKNRLINSGVNKIWDLIGTPILQEPEVVV